MLKGYLNFQKKAIESDQITCKTHGRLNLPGSGLWVVFGIAE
jgi:hypothetical protein